MSDAIERLKILKANLKVATDMIDSSDKAIDISLEEAIRRASDSERQTIQKQAILIKSLAKKARKGQNIDNEIKEIKKNINLKK